MINNFKKILVTGCAGFVGSNLVDFFLKKKKFILGIDNFSTGKSQYQGAYFARGTDNPYSMNIKGQSEDLTWLTK